MYGRVTRRLLGPADVVWSEAPRVVRCAATLFVIGTAVAGVGGVAWAQARSAARAVAPDRAGQEPASAHPQHQRALTKVRQGSMLRRDVAEPPQQRRDRRGTFERMRDAELAKHYRRVAELDVIAEVARRRRDVALAEDVATVRLRETHRFRMAMKRLRQQSERYALSGRL